MYLVSDVQLQLRFDDLQGHGWKWKPVMSCIRIRIRPHLTRFVMRQSRGCTCKTPAPRLYFVICRILGPAVCYTDPAGHLSSPSTSARIDRCSRATPGTPHGAHTHGGRVVACSNILGCPVIACVPPVAATPVLCALRAKALRCLQCYPACFQKAFRLTS